MSTVPPSGHATVTVPARGNDRLRVYGHSTLFYWWPVWLLGFILTLWSWFEGTRVVHIPSGTEVTKADDTTYHLHNPKDAPGLESRLARFLPPEQRPEELKADARQNPPRVSRAPWMGALYCVVLLVVIAITNIPLRGLWSVVVIVSFVLLAVIFALAGLWDDIFNALGGLHVYIGMAGYLFISLVLFILWVVSVLVFDRQIYITFEPGQMKVVEEVGGGEKSYDTIGMSIEKHRDDLFRHWVLGLGSGDLTVRTSGATPHQFTLNNVLFVSSKLDVIEQLQREKQIRFET